MKRNIFKLGSGCCSLAVWWAGLGGAVCRSNGADGVPLQTNLPAVILESLVADVLERNPELNFYKAEIAAAKGERRSAATWANPELVGTIGDKRVTDGSFAGEGVAWSVSVRQT